MKKMLSLNHKTIRRDDWKRVLDKDVYIRDFSMDGINGKISLLKIKKISSPLAIDYGTDKVTIVEVGYSWVQIALEGQFFWITSMFDDEDRLIEIYIDMTDGNITNVEDPYFTDLFLDYVVHIKSDLVLELDREELNAAYEKGIISSGQYRRTIQEGEKVAKYLRTHRKDLEQLLIQEQRKLKYGE